MGISYDVIAPVYGSQINQAKSIYTSINVITYCLEA